MPAEPVPSLDAIRLSGVDLGLAHLLDAAELDRAATFRSPALQNRFLAGRIALRLHISALTGEDPGSLIADYACPSCRNHGDTGHGIPQYRLPSHPGRLRASLSRSGDWCLLAASLDQDVEGIGVDIEDGTAADFAEFQSLALTANERRELHNAPPALGVRLQTGLWVRKEAVLKALGTGLAQDPVLVDVSGSQPAVLGQPPLPGLWNLEDINPASVGLPDNFIASRAVRRAARL
ncbi:hypothetical protein GCM10007170_07080 [Arthrobacter liuii]|uniref:4'-phosphopantetheinyl transferase domain-containing protein n=2 Tax=Arthrobacter liuii TaxID=1476996 RepID=A0ABQ2AK32_9MICC|nr:hypothetical protein GCM10007170_07080 [Arthrobacter liuii]